MDSGSVPNAALPGGLQQLRRLRKLACSLLALGCSGSHSKGLSGSTLRSAAADSGAKRRGIQLRAFDPPTIDLARLAGDGPGDLARLAEEFDQVFSTSAPLNELSL